MSRPKPPKSEGSSKGASIPLPDWWLEELRSVAKGITLVTLAKELSELINRDPPFSHQAISDFLNGKVTTDVMLRAFCRRFPELPPPVFWASSLKEARLFQELAELRKPVAQRKPPPKLERTAEDFDADESKATEPETAVESKRTRK